MTNTGTRGRRTVILGGGITGLAAAWEAVGLGDDVRVLEVERGQADPPHLVDWQELAVEPGLHVHRPVPRQRLEQFPNLVVLSLQDRQHETDLGDPLGAIVGVVDALHRRRRFEGPCEFRRRGRGLLGRIDAQATAEIQADQRMARRQQLRCQLGDPAGGLGQRRDVHDLGANVAGNAVGGQPGVFADALVQRARPLDLEDPAQLVDELVEIPAAVRALPDEGPDLVEGVDLGVRGADDRRLALDHARLVLGVLLRAKLAH